MNAGFLWAGWNLIRTGNVLGIKHEDEYERLERNLNELDKNLDILNENLSSIGEQKVSFGPTEKDEPVDQEVIRAKKRARNLSSIQGMSAEIQVLQQRNEVLIERLNRLEGLYMTLANKFQQFETQRAIELHHLVNHGPTERD